MKPTFSTKNQGSHCWLPFFWSTRGLEDQLQTELDITTFIRTSGGRLSRAARERSALLGDDEIGAREVGRIRHHVEVVVVEDVIHLASDLHREPLCHLEVLVNT